VASHKFLVRSGYIRQLGAGIYSYLFLGQRAINKIIAIVREEMDQIGQEFYLPAILPREPWEQSGRWTGMGDNMFRLKDRKGADLCLGMTHEEIMTTIARERTAQLQAVAADLVPDSDQIPRRAASQVGAAARAPVHHEGQRTPSISIRPAWTRASSCTTPSTAGSSPAAA
jgi:hypothetical protein